MSLKESSQTVKEKAKELREEFRSTMQNLGQGIPRPLMERPTLILKEPLLKQFMRKRGEKAFK